MKASRIIKATAIGGPRVDWKAERDRIDLADVLTRLLGPPPGRRGERGRRLWWSCPFHEDANPSLSVDPGKPWWRCYGCDARGDAATLVMKLNGRTFPEALAFLTGGPSPSTRRRPGPVVGVPAPRRHSDDPDNSERRSGGLSPEAAAVLVDEAAARLWTPEGADALTYLIDARMLAPATIRAARLGVVIRARQGVPPGIVIPWLAGDAPALVKVRPTSGRPKYREIFRDRARLTCYPGPGAIRPGRPLILVEGEFDALLIGQALGERAVALTLGSASARAGPGILGPLLSASPWYVATDADPAGDDSAAAWDGYPCARRVRPPEPFKDWTEAAASPEGTRGCGVDLRRWWADVLAGIDRPPLFTWPELAAWRWGEGPDHGPGIIVP